MPEICESIILTLTSLLNHPQTRKYVRTHLDIEVKSEMQEAVGNFVTLLELIGSND